MKKNVPLIVICSLCGIVMAGGIAASVAGYVSNSKLSGAIEKADKNLNALRNQKKSKKSSGLALALSDENRERGDETVNALRNALRSRFSLMMQPKRLETGFDGDSTQLVSNLLKRKTDLEELFKKNHVEIADSARSFGFARYLENNETAPAGSLKALDEQVAGIDEILKSLVGAHDKYDKDLVAAHVMTMSEKTPIKIVAVEREAVELSAEQQRALVRGEFIVKPAANSGDSGFCSISDGQNSSEYVSLRRADAVRAMALRIKFLADSGVLRNFVRRMEDYAIYIRDISAVRAPENLLPPKNVPAAPVAAPGASANPFELFGASSPAAVPAAPRVPARRVVVENVPELFTVTLEYVSPIVAQQRKNAEKSE